MRTAAKVKTVKDAGLLLGFIFFSRVGFDESANDTSKPARWEGEGRETVG
jgi:hypothetical protein